MAAYRKSDQRRACRCAVALRLQCVCLGLYFFKSNLNIALCVFALRVKAQRKPDRDTSQDHRDETGNYTCDFHKRLLYHLTTCAESIGI